MQKGKLEEAIPEFNEVKRYTKFHILSKQTQYSKLRRENLSLVISYNKQEGLKTLWKIVLDVHNQM